MMRQDERARRLRIPFFALIVVFIIGVLSVFLR